jgi:SAM-dependent methyltransferase
MKHFNLPSPALLQHQADWLAPARARILRRASIAHRKNVLDIGCGHGAVTEELSRRCGGQVVALDCRQNVFTDTKNSFTNSNPICGDALHLPFSNSTFDLIFCQFTLLWLDARAVIKEIHRILQPNGVLVAIEPDYGGMIEHPPELATRDIWISALIRAGADPCIGRKLPTFMPQSVWNVEINLLDRMLPPSPTRFELLKELPLTEEEKENLSHIQAADPTIEESARVVHLPLFIILAEKIK